MNTYDRDRESYDSDIFAYDPPVMEAEPEPEPEPEAPPMPEPEPKPQTEAFGQQRDPQLQRQRPAATKRPVETKTGNTRRTVKSKKKTRKSSSTARVLTDTRTRMFFGVVLGLITVYLLIVTFSYFSNATHDQNVVVSNTFGALTAAPEKVTNAGGPLGAWIAEMVVSAWMGLSSFIMIAWLGAVSLALLRVRKMRFWPVTLKCLLATVASSVILGFATYQMSSAIYWGGMHGHMLIRAAAAIGGIWGAICLTVLMVAVLIILFYRVLRRGWRKARVAVVRYRRRAAIARAEREAEAARKAEIAAQKAAEEAARRAEAEAEAEAKCADTAETESPVAEAMHTPEEPEYEEISLPDDIEEVGLMPEDTNELEQPENLTGPDSIATIGGMVIESPKYENATKSDIKRAQRENEPTEPYDPRLDLSHFNMPVLDLMVDRGQNQTSIDVQEQEENQQRITKVLLDYDIPISSIKATVGPTVTLYEIVPAEGIRIAKIKRLEDDIALSLAAEGIRIIAPIPGKGTIGIEVPNKSKQIVAIRSILGSKAYTETKMDLPLALGCTISNEVFIVDLAKMPHLLVAGATGTGKSVGLNTIIASLLYKRHPAELKLVMIDPKRVEFSLYNKLENHYLAKIPGDDDAIITDISKVVATLNSLCLEMEHRYDLLKNACCRDIKEYNTKFVERRLNPEKGHRYLPYIVVIVDEYADLMMTAGKEVETPIARIAQMARAVGIHMILATQRPSANIVTGVIKANFPARIAFRVFTMVDSRTILDSPGANQLSNQKGDMLYTSGGQKERVQCAFISTAEVEGLCEYINNQQGYGEPYELPEFVPDEDGGGSSMANLADRDPLFEEVARYVVMSGTTASTSSIQRRWSIGYNRAGRIMDQLEHAGIVGASTGGKPRQVLVDSLQVERILEMAN